MNTQTRRVLQLEKSETIAKMLIELGVNMTQFNSLSKTDIVSMTNDSYVAMLPLSSEKEYQLKDNKEEDENTFDYFMTLLKFDFIRLYLVNHG